MIGDEIGLTGHLLTGVVDIGDRGLPTRSHGKMREVIDLISRLQGVSNSALTVPSATTPVVRTPSETK